MKRIASLLLALVLIVLMAAFALADYKEYKLNDYSEDIKKIQQRLVKLEYLSGKPDGWFGEKTKSAFKKFQLVHGLEVTGMADAASQELLNSDQAQVSPKVLMSLTELKKLMSESGQLGVKYDLSDMVVDRSSAAVELNNFVTLSCDLLGDDVTEIQLIGEENVKIPFTMLLAALDSGIGANNVYGALDALIEQEERVVNGMRIRYEIDDKNVQRLIVTPLEDGGAR